MSAGTHRFLRAYAALFAVLMLAPLAVVIVASLTSGGFVQVPPDHWGLRWYRAAFDDPQFVSAFKFSLESALCVAVLAGVIGVACAIAIVRFSFPGRRVVEGLVLAPLMIPHVVIAIGVVKLCDQLDLATAPWGLIGGQTVLVLPFVIRIAAIGIKGVDPRLELAARSLGASRLYSWRRIVIPMAAPSVVAGFIFAFLLSFDEAVVSLFTSVPGKTTLPVQIFNYAEQRADPLIAAASSIVIVLALVVIIVIDRMFGLLAILSGETAATRQ